MKKMTIALFILTLVFIVGGCLLLAPEDNGENGNGEEEPVYGVQFVWEDDPDSQWSPIRQIGQRIHGIVPGDTYKFSVMFKSKNIHSGMAFNRNFSLRVNMITEDGKWFVKDDHIMEDITIDQSPGSTVNLDNNNIFIYNLDKGETDPEWEELWYEFEATNPEVTEGVIGEFQVQLYCRFPEGTPDGEVIFTQPKLVNLNDPSVNLLANPELEIDFVGDLPGWSGNIDKDSVSIVEVNL